MRIDYDSLGVDLLFEVNVRDQPPKVSVHMITYGHEKFIVQAVSSVLEGTYDDYELIISDDASPDNTKVVLLEYLNNYKGSGQVRYVRHRKNSRNGGMGHVVVFNKLSRGSLIMKMDGDDWSCPNRLERTVSLWQSLEPEPSIMVVNAYSYRDESCKVDGLAKPCKMEIGAKCYYPPCSNPLKSGAPVFGSGTVMSQRFFDWCKQFGSHKPVIAGDVIRSKRALLDKGVWFVNEPLFYYRVHGGSVSRFSEKVWIHDRVTRFEILANDMRMVCPPSKALDRSVREVQRLAQAMRIEEYLADCPNHKWFFKWIQLLMIKPQEALNKALKMRIKLIVKNIRG